MAEIMTTQQVAEYLQVPVATLYQWRWRHEGPRAARVGRHLRYRRTDLDTWLGERLLADLASPR